MGKQTMNELIEKLKVLLANMSAFRIKAQYYHWNVTGPNFKEYHGLFNDLYSSANDYVDDIAEHIRALNAFAPGSLSRFKELSTINDETTIPNAIAMISVIAMDNKTLHDNMMEIHEVAQNNKQFGLLNFIEGLLDSNEKTQWMLDSFLKR